MFQDLRLPDRGDGLMGGSRRDNSETTLVQSRLQRRRQHELMFQDLLAARGFEHLELPMVMPQERFRSLCDGRLLLPAGPGFRDPAGVDWVLRSDMTAFSAQFVRSRVARSGASILRLGYAGSVLSYPQVPAHYGREEGLGPSTASEVRGHGLHHPYLESHELGAEIIGQLGDDEELETLDLALQAAMALGFAECLVVLGHTAVTESLLDHAAGHGFDRSQVLRSIACCDEGRLDSIPGFDEIKNSAVVISGLERMARRVQDRSSRVRVVLDPLLVRPQGFYSGLTFEIHAIFADEQGSRRLVRVGAGGRYDELFRHYQVPVSACGFKICDPLVIESELRQRFHAVNTPGSLSDGSLIPLRIAVPKGRLMGRVLGAFAAVGILPDSDPETSRQLVLKSTCGLYEFLIVKNSDVPAFVESGTADLGIVGSDVLEECGSQIARPMTFSFGQTRICLAGRQEQRVLLENQRATPVVVASKYPRMAARELSRLGMDSEILPLSGSVELASVIGLADAIVDLVETGRTLVQNGLVVFKDLCQTQVHLCVAKGMRYQNSELLKNWRQEWLRQGLIVSGKERVS
jgi:ATP phosphoribosyltransferase